MIKLVILFSLLAVSSASPKRHSTVFVQPKERDSRVSTDGLSRLSIVNGDVAKPHQFPYQVGMYVYTSSYTDFCGGSLISPNYVLTAAHCVDKAVKLNLIFGAHNVTATETSQVRLSSSSFIIHEGWDGETINKNDVALVRLPSPVKETSAIKYVPLAKGSNTYAQNIGAVAGWGVTKTSQTEVTAILRYITPSIISNDDCKKVDKDYEGIVVDTLLCISGAGKKGTCQGDSGGPLVVKGEQVGVVSFGANDCEEGKPSVFTRVTEYYDWIVKNSDVKL